VEEPGSPASELAGVEEPGSRQASLLGWKKKPHLAAPNLCSVAVKML